VAALLARLRLPPGSSFQRGALDWVVDRLPHAKLVRLTSACVSALPVESLRLLPKRLRALRALASTSLRAAGLLVGANELRSPYQPSPVCIDRATGEPSQQCPAMNEPTRAHNNNRRVRPDAVGVMVAMPREGRVVFKVLDVALVDGDRRRDGDDGNDKRNRNSSSNSNNNMRDIAGAGRGSGSICHQSSVLTSERLQQLVAAEGAAGDDVVSAMAGMDKKALCDLYEVVLRQLRPAAVVRVAQ
jgi:hypothetical protein